MLFGKRMTQMIHVCVRACDERYIFITTFLFCYKFISREKIDVNGRLLYFRLQLKLVVELLIATVRAIIYLTHVLWKKSGQGMFFLVKAMQKNCFVF